MFDLQMFRVNFYDQESNFLCWTKKNSTLDGKFVAFHLIYYEL